VYSACDACADRDELGKMLGTIDDVCFTVRVKKKLFFLQSAEEQETTLISKLTPEQGLKHVAHRLHTSYQFILCSSLTDLIPVIEWGPAQC
jgi:hypothetical protein